MEQLFNIDFNRIHSSDEKEAAGRKKNFELFLKRGLPNKKDENWKFSDLNFIISKNFKNITNNDEYKFDEKIELINDFDHNNIILVTTYTISKQKAYLLSVLFTSLLLTFVVVLH